MGPPQCSPDWLWNHKAAESALQLELLGQAPTYLGPKLQFVALISFVFKWWSEPVRLATHWVLICLLVFFMPCTLKRTHVCMWVDGTKCTRLTATEVVTTGNFSPLSRIIKSIPASPQITIIFKFQASVHPKKKNTIISQVWITTLERGHGGNYCWEHPSETQSLASRFPSPGSQLLLPLISIS